MLYILMYISNYNLKFVVLQETSVQQDISVLIQPHSIAIPPLQNVLGCYKCCPLSYVNKQLASYNLLQSIFQLFCGHRCGCANLDLRLELLLNEIVGHNFMYLQALLNLYFLILKYTLSVCMLLFLNDFVTEGARLVVTYDMNSIVQYTKYNSNSIAQYFSGENLTQPICIFFFYVDFF